MSKGNSCQGDRQSEILRRSWTTTTDRFAADRIKLFPCIFLLILFSRFSWPRIKDLASSRRAQHAAWYRAAFAEILRRIPPAPAESSTERRETGIRDDERTETWMKVDLKAIKRILLHRRRVVTDTRTLARTAARTQKGLLEKFDVNDLRRARRNFAYLCREYLYFLHSPRRVSAAPLDPLRSQASTSVKRVLEDG